MRKYMRKIYEEKRIKKFRKSVNTERKKSRRIKELKIV